MPRDTDNLFVTFLAGSTVVTARAFYTSASDADAASAAAEIALADPQMASAALGIPVTGTSRRSPYPSLPLTRPFLYPSRAPIPQPCTCTPASVLAPRASSPVQSRARLSHLIWLDLA